MKASQVRVSELNTYDELEQAAESIERDYRNVVGGLKAWVSGHQTHFTKGAERKLAAINRKLLALDEKNPEMTDGC